ncbi:MAG: hypothetical protein ABI780_09710 [Ardenticatenales bacterium]
MRTPPALAALAFVVLDAALAIAIPATAARPPSALPAGATNEGPSLVLSAPLTATDTATSTLPATATLTPPAVTSTAAPTATAGSSTPTSTVTPTLAPEWGVDALCACHVPPFPPDSPECERLKASYVATVVSGWASQTTLARGTDTPTAPPTDTATASPSPSATPRPTDEPTPTSAPTWTPIPTWTARVVVVTATPEPEPSTAPRRRLWLPFAYLRRSRR